MQNRKAQKDIYRTARKNAPKRPERYTVTDKESGETYLVEQPSLFDFDTDERNADHG